MDEHNDSSVAVMRYNGCSNFGILGDYDAVPDIQVVADDTSDSDDDLFDATSKVQVKGKAAKRKPSTTLRRSQRQLPG